MAFLILILAQVAAVSLSIFVARRIPSPGLAYLVGNLTGVLILMLVLAIFFALSAFAILGDVRDLPFQP